MLKLNQKLKPGVSKKIELLLAGTIAFNLLHFLHNFWFLKDIYHNSQFIKIALLPTLLLMLGIAGLGLYFMIKHKIKIAFEWFVVYGILNTFSLAHYFHGPKLSLSASAHAAIVGEVILGATFALYNFWLVFHLKNKRKSRQSSHK